MSNYGPKYNKTGTPTTSPALPLPDSAKIKAIVIDGDPVALVELADNLGKELVDEKLTTSQIRNVYGTVRQIQLRWDTDPQKSYRDAVLLRPKMAYFAEKEKKNKGNKSKGMEILHTYLEPAIQLLSEPNIDDKERKKRFDYFTDFFEAIVAYHRKHGGREN